MIKHIPLDQIQQNPWQTRGEPSEEHIQDLATDIESNGLLQTPVGRMDGDQVQLAFGHNRLAAFRVLAARGETLENGTVSPWLRLPVDVLALTDEQMAMMAWSENEKRRDLSPMERARAVIQRMENFGWSQAQAAEKLGLSRTTVANITRLLDLPQNIQDELDAGNISERSAMALLPLYEVSVDILNGMAYSYWSPRDIVKDALGGASSDAIRKKVNELFERAFINLHQAPFKLAEVFPEGEAIYCGTCSTCDKRLASRNLCMDKDCYEGKLRVVRHRYLEAASLTSGYDIIDESKGGFPSMLPSNAATLEKVLATKCKNLRVAYDVSGNGRDDPRRIEGHPKALLVCDKRNDSCTCLKGMQKLMAEQMSKGIYPAIPAGALGREDKAAEDVDDLPIHRENPGTTPDPLPKGNGNAPAGPTPAELEDVMRKERRDRKYAAEKAPEIQRLVADLLAGELANDAPGVFLVLVTGYVWNTVRDVPPLEKIYERAGIELARKFMPNDFQSVGQILKYVNGRLEALGLPQISLEKRLVEVFEEEAER